MLFYKFLFPSFGYISESTVVKIKNYLNYDSSWEEKTPTSGIFEHLFPQILRSLRMTDLINFDKLIDVDLKKFKLLLKSVMLCLCVLLL